MELLTDSSDKCNTPVVVHFNFLTCCPLWAPRELLRFADSLAEKIHFKCTIQLLQLQCIAVSCVYTIYFSCANLVSLFRPILSAYKEFSRKSNHVTPQVTC